MLLGAALLVGGAPAPAGTGPRDEDVRAFRLYREAVEDAVASSNPLAERFFDSLQLDETRRRVTWHRPIDDLDGDGASEVLLERWRFTFDLLYAGVTGDYRAQVLDGKRGTVSWTYRSEYEGGFPLLASRIRLGGGAPGLLFAKIDNQSAASPTYRLSVEAVDATGNPQWSRAFTSTFTFTTGGLAATDVPTSFQKFEPDGDPSSAFLVALTDFVRAAATDRAIARSDVYALDARDGSMRGLGSVGPDTYWFHAIQAGPDLDGAGGEDVLIVGEENSPDSYIEARSGIDGTTLWRKETHVGWYPWAAAVPDMTSDGARDFVLGWDRPNSDTRLFEIWDARGARPLWRARGTFPYILGDRDRDGTPDIGAFEFVHRRDRTGARFLAYSKGRLLYETPYLVKRPKCTSLCLSFGFYLDAGDIDGDDLRDTYVLLSLPTGRRTHIVEYATSGADGSLLYRQRRLAPVLGSIDARRGDDLVGHDHVARDLLEVTAYDGIRRDALWTKTYRMTGARNLGPYGAYDALAELDGDTGGELLIQVAGRRNATLVALDGATGAILWQRPVLGDARVVENR